MNVDTVSEAERTRQRFRLFSELGGKFRVALVNVCNLRCFFCHNEGMTNPRRSSIPPPRLGDDDLLAIINAYARLGGPQINITGGEPLSHRDLAGFLERIDKRQTRVVLNTNAVLADRLLGRPVVRNLDGILASLHTTSNEVFRDQLGGRSIDRVMRNIVALRDHGYSVKINYSLGDYNRREFVDVLGFAVEHRIHLKVIALVRPDERRDFYGGSWIDPSWIAAALRGSGAGVISSKKSIGGHTTTYALGETIVEVKNIAQGRLETDFCRGCSHREACGEGIYGLRVGPDGLWKPCLLRRERFRDVAVGKCYEEQILSIVDAMIGDWSNATFRTGAPA